MFALVSMAWWRPPDTAMGKPCTTTLGPCLTPALTSCLILTPSVGLHPSAACSLPQGDTRSLGLPWSPPDALFLAGMVGQGWPARPCPAALGSPVLWDSVTSRPFLNLVVPLSILKIHSFPAPMVKHCFKCSAK